LLLNYKNANKVSKNSLNIYSSVFLPDFTSGCLLAKYFYFKF